MPSGSGMCWVAWQMARVRDAPPAFQVNAPIPTGTVPELWLFLLILPPFYLLRVRSTNAAHSDRRLAAGSLGECAQI